MQQYKCLASQAQIQSKQFWGRITIASTQAANTHHTHLNSVIAVPSPTLAFPTIKNPSLSFLRFTNIASQRSDQIARHFSSSSPSSDKMSYGKQPSEFNVRKIGSPNTLEFRAFIEKDGTPVSPFHDVPLYANEQQTVLNMVVEIPRWTNAKLEVRPLTDSGLSSIDRTNSWLTRSPKKSS
jgi:inorganic pyrophosphatase